MPVSLLLQAEGEVWTLPKEELPRNLPAHVDKRGLFQIRPTFDYLRAKFENDYFSVRRSTFLIKPADTITVYAAQGSTFDAVIADMQKPPQMGQTTHWLACHVMLSRAKSIEGLLVLRPAARDQLSARPSQFLLDELDRLEQTVSVGRGLEVWSEGDGLYLLTRLSEDASLVISGKKGGRIDRWRHAVECDVDMLNSVMR